MSFNPLFSLLKETEAKKEAVLSHLTEAEFRMALQEGVIVVCPKPSVFTLPSEEYLELLGLCRLYYNLEKFPTSAPFFRFSLSSLCSDLAFSADLCMPTGSVDYLGSADCEIGAVPHVIRWAILNLLSEAIHAAKDATLCLRLQEKESYILLFIEGNFPYSRKAFEEQLQVSNSPLSYCLRAAKLHDGQLLFRESEEKNAFLLCLPKTSIQSLSAYRLETFDELLSDRFSVLYAALLP